jgi:fatty acid desaturase
VSSRSFHVESGYSLPGSPDLQRIENPSSGAWLSFRKGLRPKYGTIWRDIAVCLLMAVGGFASHVFLTMRRGNAFGLEIGILFAIWIGFWLNAILTFGHEAAHYNLAPTHRWNDALADWSIWLFFPQSTRAYRRSHWQHHLHLGDPQDTEISYHNCLSPWFLAKTLTGGHLALLVFRYVLGRRSTDTAAESQGDSSALVPLGITPILRAMAAHSLFVGVAIALGCFASAIVWLASAVLIFPFFASMRQLLEHRSSEAACEIDFRQVHHGPVNRMFGTDLFSKYFGAAGFNWHLLHHWDPTVSYTRFDDMQKFFAGTEYGEDIERARSTYWAASVLLLRRALDGSR